MTGKDLYNIAKKYLRQGGAKFRKFCGLPSGAPYCCAYVTYIFWQGKVAKLFYGGKKVTYCPNAIKWCQAHLGQVPIYLAMPMDIIFFDWNNNNVPDHIGFVKAKKSSSDIFTHEGNTSGGIVAEKTRPVKYVMGGVFRPHYKPTGLSKAKLKVDGDFGYKSVYMFQTMLGVKADGILGKQTIKKWQAYLKVAQDGSWGRKTTLAAQKLLKIKQDGAWGEKSTRALQTYINDKCYPKQNTSKPIETKPTTPSKPPTTATLKSYRIEVDLTNQICTVYGVYSDGKSKPIMSEWVSTARKGKTTPTGKFKIQGASGGRKAKLRTAKMYSGKSYAEFLCRFYKGKCMHTVPYKKRNKSGYVDKDNFNKLGTPASAGCVRMPYKLAKFIYTNCKIGTPVIVFKGKKGVYPMGKPKKYIATSNVDPTK